MEPRTMLTTDETVGCTCCFIRRFFGFGGRASRRSPLVRRAAESGLTIAEFIAAVKTGGSARPGSRAGGADRGFRRECRLAWKRMQDENNPGSR